MPFHCSHEYNDSGGWNTYFLYHFRFLTFISKVTGLGQIRLVAVQYNWLVIGVRDNVIRLYSHVIKACVQIVL